MAKMPEKYTLETRGVLAGAYRGKGTIDGATFLHSGVIPEGESWPTRTLCGKIDSDRLCDINENPKPPTCPGCAKRLATIALKALKASR